MSEPVKEPEKTEPISASEGIRKEIRAMLGKGTDLSRQPVYSPILKDLANKYQVKYPVAKRAFDQVMVEGGQKEPAVAPTTHKVGDVEAVVAHKPKANTQAPTAPQITPQNTVNEDKPETIAPLPQEEKARLKLILKSLLQSSSEGLFQIAAKAFNVEIKQKREEEYDTAAGLWADVCEAYGVTVPKILVLLAAGGYTMQMIALPIVGAATEARRRQAEELARKKREEEKQNEPKKRATA